MAKKNKKQGESFVESRMADDLEGQSEVFYMPDMISVRHFSPGNLKLMWETDNEDFLRSLIYAVFCSD